MTKNFKIKIKSTNIRLLNLYSFFIQKVLKKCNMTFNRITFKKTKRYTLLKSPHVYKKAREQFFLKIYKQTILIKKISLNLKYLHFLILNKPKAIKLIFEKV